MTQAATAVVRRQIVVDAPIEQAFTVFVERFGDFKPREHNLLTVPIAATVFEPRVGGHIYDRGVDGSECRWARILAYEPPTPRRLQLGHRADLATRTRPGPRQRGRSRLHRRGTGPDPDRAGTPAS